MTRYRGRHRAPSITDTVVENSGRITAAVVTTGVFATLPVLAAAPAFADTSSSTLDAIARCESDNNPTAKGPVTKAGGHFGLFQFDQQTWESVGGKGNPRNASVAEQYKRAEMLLASRGTQPWNASKSCWSSKVGESKAKAPVVKTESKRSSGKVAEQSDTGKRRAGTEIPDGYVVKRGDTLNNLAARFDVDGGFRAIANANHIANPDRIYVGQKLN